MNNIYERVVKCILEVDKVEGINFIQENNITSEFSLTYFDFIEMYDLYNRIEKEFSVEIDDMEFLNLKTVQDIVTTIERIIK